MSSASSRSCRRRAPENRSHLFRRPGQQDLKVVIARTSPVWRTVARCWRNGVVLVSEHYIESFRQEGQDARQNNQGCRITHACRSTASDGCEKIRLTATSLGRRLASLLGKLPTPRAHETPPASGAFINVLSGSLSAPESAPAPCYTEEAEAKQAERARFGDARRGHSRCISSHARLRDTPGPGVGEGPTSRRQIHGDQVVCVKTTPVVVKTPRNISRQTECRRIEQHAAEIFGQRCANTAKAASLRNRKARNAKKPRHRGSRTQGEVNCAREPDPCTRGLRPVVYELLSWRHARVRLRGKEHHKRCRSCDSSA